MKKRFWILVAFAAASYLNGIVGAGAGGQYVCLFRHQNTAFGVISGYADCQLRHTGGDQFI